MLNDLTEKVMSERSGRHHAFKTKADSGCLSMTNEDWDKSPTTRDLPQDEDRRVSGNINLNVDHFHLNHRFTLPAFEENRTRSSGLAEVVTQ